MKILVLSCLFLEGVAFAQLPLDQARQYTVQSTIENGQGTVSIRVDPQDTVRGATRTYHAPLSGGPLSCPVNLFPGDNKISVKHGSVVKEVSAKLEVKAPEVRVELRWAGRNQDYDLYVNGVNWRNTDDEGGQLDQDWISEDNGDSNPGVENITFKEAEGGLYRIAVNYYDDNEDDDDDGQPDGSPQATTVNVFVDGESVYTATRAVSKYDRGASFWEVGTLVIHSGNKTGGYWVDPSTRLRDMLPQKVFLDKVDPHGEFKVDEITGPNGTDDVYMLVGRSAQFELTGTVNVDTENEVGNVKIIGDFEVSDTSIAIVDETGVLTGIAAGTVELRSVLDKSKKVIVHLLPIEVVELSPKVKDEQGNDIAGSENPSAGRPLTPFVELNPVTDRIAHRELKVRVGETLIGKTVTWTLDAVPDATPATIRGQWTHSTTHPDRFEKSATYGTNGFTRLSQASGRTTVTNDGFTAIRVNVPPVGFNQVRIRIQIEGTNTPIDLIDMEVPSVVVIDPGHGGNKTDPPVSGSSWNNATSPSGKYEKDMALAYGLELRNALIKERDEEHLNLKVFMTRDADYNVSGTKRAHKARDNGADIINIIHFNSDDATKDKNGVPRTPHRSRGTLQVTQHNNVNAREDSTTSNTIIGRVVASIQGFDAAGRRRDPVSTPTDVAEDLKLGNSSTFHPIRAPYIEVEFIDYGADTVDKSDDAVDILMNTGPNAAAVKTAIAEAMKDGIIHDLRTHVPSN